MIDRSPDLLIKIILVGDSGVGKTNVLRKFIKPDLGLDSRATIGVDF